MPAAIDLKGQKFGKLTVIALASGAKRRSWVCQCECGNIITVSTSDLRAGKSTQCRLCQLRKHGHTGVGWKSLTYSSWLSMKARCLNPNAPHYHRYGGRGITICERWLSSFENFLADMGERPSLKYTLDRIDNDASYSPENCRWATRWEQAQNRVITQAVLASVSKRQRDPVTQRFIPDVKVVHAVP